jgi:hypothetical protein
VLAREAWLALDSDALAGLKARAPRNALITGVRANTVGDVKRVGGMLLVE